MYAIGFLELNSIVRGMYAADILLKAAETELLFARESCPGKYYILVRGETDAVELALAAGIAAAEQYCVDSVLIANVHPQVLRALNQALPIPEHEALGAMEFFSVTAAVYAADAAVKAAGVEILDLRLGTGVGGKSFVTVMGDIGAVEEAVRAGASHGQAQGMLIASTVIPRPTRSLLESMY